MAKKKKSIPVDKKIEKLIEIYKEAEKRLIKTISEKEIRGNTTTFYKEMLKQVQQELLRLKIFHTQWATDITKQLYMQAYEEVLSDLGISDNTLTQLHKEAIELIAENIVNNLNEATDLVGRRVEDEIRNISLDSATNKFATGSTIKQMQDELKNNLINNNITSFKDRLGRNINISSYAEMIARSIVAETQNTCVMNTMFEHGNDLVKMSTHFGTCSVCATYEGRVYSITGYDERFPRLDEIPGFNKGYNNIHPRCRHRIRPWIEKYNDAEEEIKNSNRPFEVDKDKEASVRAYQEEQKAKARLRNDKKQYERYKQVLGDKSPKNFQSFRKIKYNNIEEWNIKQREFSTINSVNNKKWSDIYKEKVKSTYYDFRKDNIELSWHGSQRFVDRNIDKNGNIIFTKKNIVDMFNTKPNYIQQDGRLVNFKNGIAIIRSSETGEIVSVVVRKNPKKEWIKND